jgi:hypothetical protein
MLCRLCGQRRARRACPALGHDICTVCCGTKRQVEIHCPADCPHLTAAREHPPAAALRQRQQDLDVALLLVRDFNQRQSQIFFLVATFLVRYQPPELHQLLDADVAEAATALAATYETAMRGVIYEHQATTVAGARLAAALKPLLQEAGQGGGTSFERDAAVVLRRIEDVARHRTALAASAPRALVEVFGRMIRTTDEANGPTADVPRLIVP